MTTFPTLFTGRCLPLLTTLLAGLFVAPAASAQSPLANPLNWRTLHPENATDVEPSNEPGDVCAPNDSTLVLTRAIYGNRLYRTTDRGLTWQVSARPAPRGTKTFFSATDGLVSYDSAATLPARRRGQLRFTTNGGDSWSAPRPAPTGIAVFESAAQGLVFQRRLPGTLLVYRTQNGGQSWSVLDSLSGLPSLHHFDSKGLVSVPSATTAYLYVGDSLVRKVVRVALGQHTWRAFSLPNAQPNVYASELRQILFSTDSAGLALDDSGFEQRVFSTANGGRTWTRLPTPTMTGGINNSFALLNQQYLLAKDDWPGQQNELMRTSNGGQAWHSVPMLDYTPQPDGPGNDYNMLGVDGGSFTASQASGLALRPSGVAWAVGGQGRIYYSTDFGATWTLRSRVLQAGEPIAIGFPDPGHGYVASRSDAVMRTLDQGDTWQRLANTPSLQVFTSAAFPDADSLFLVTWDNPSKIYRSTDAGQSWSITPSPINYVRAIAFTEGAHRGVIVGDGGKVGYTTDGGQTWQAGVSGTTSRLFQVAWATPQTAYATGFTTVIRTTDGGATWQPLTTVPPSTNYGAIAFPTPSIGLLSVNNSLYRTTDGGLTWTVVSNTAGYNIAFSSAAVGWTQAQCTQDSGRTWTPLYTRGLPMPLDADNGWVLNQTEASAGPTAKVIRYSKHFLRTAPLPITALTTGSPHSIAFTMEGEFTPAERDFRVELSNAMGRFRAGQTTTIGQGTASPISVTIPASQPLGTRYRLRVVRADGSVIGADNGQDLTLQRATGLAPEAEVLAAPRLFPNPAQRTVTIAFADGAQAGRTVRLLDLAGRTVLAVPATAAETHVQLTGVPAGCYLLQTRSLDGRFCSQRLLIQP